MCAPLSAFAQTTEDPLYCLKDWVSECFGPAEGVFGTIIAEDRWPSQGDLDFNDLVLAYNVVQRLDADGNTTSMRLTVQPLAVGGTIHNGLALRLPGSGPLVFRGAKVTFNGVTTDAEIVDDRTVIISNDLRTAFDGMTEESTAVVNARRDIPVSRSKALVVDLVFKKGQPIPHGAVPGDLFFFYSDDRSHQIHRPNYSGTPSMNHSLFGTEDDGSDGSRNFVDKDGLPFMIVLPTELPKWPTEGVDIATLYPEIVGFASSGGERNRNFYEHPVENVAFPYKITPNVGSNLWTGMDVKDSVGVYELKTFMTDTLPAGEYRFEMTGSGQAELYGWKGASAEPNMAGLFCASGNLGTNELCTLTLTEPTAVTMLVIGYSAANFRLLGFDTASPPVGPRFVLDATGPSRCPPPPYPVWSMLGAQWEHMSDNFWEDWYGMSGPYYTYRGNAQPFLNAGTWWESWTDYQYPDQTHILQRNHFSNLMIDVEDLLEHIRIYDDVRLESIKLTFNYYPGSGQTSGQITPQSYRLYRHDHPGVKQFRGGFLDDVQGYAFPNVIEGGAPEIRGSMGPGYPIYTFEGEESFTVTLTNITGNVGFSYIADNALRAPQSWSMPRWWDFRVDERAVYVQMEVNTVPNND